LEVSDNFLIQLPLEFKVPLGVQPEMGIVIRLVRSPVTLRKISVGRYHDDLVEEQKQRERHLLIPRERITVEGAVVRMRVLGLWVSEAILIVHGKEGVQRA